MRTNFDDLLKKTGGGLGGVGVFLYGAQSFCSTEKATEVKQFFDQHPFPAPSAISVRQWSPSTAACSW